MLTVDGPDVAYDDFQVLWAPAARERGEIVCVLGPNGAGKSTLMTRSRCWCIRAPGASHSSISASMDSPRIVRRDTASPTSRAPAPVPFLTVLDNVLLGATTPGASPARRDAGAVEALFPVVRARSAQLAHTLRARAQMSDRPRPHGVPASVMVDRPFLGLAPRVAQDIASSSAASGSGGDQPSSSSSRTSRCASARRSRLHPGIRAHDPARPVGGALRSSEVKRISSDVAL